MNETQEHSQIYIPQCNSEVLYRINLFPSACWWKPSTDLCFNTRYSGYCRMRLIRSKQPVQTDPGTAVTSPHIFVATLGVFTVSIDSSTVTQHW